VFPPEVIADDHRSRTQCCCADQRIGGAQAVLRAQRRRTLSDGVLADVISL
jgi:hypothetical protein